MTKINDGPMLALIGIGFLIADYVIMTAIFTR